MNHTRLISVDICFGSNLKKILITIFESGLANRIELERKKSWGSRSLDIPYKTVYEKTYFLKKILDNEIPIM